MSPQRPLLITGASGFVGRHLTASLLADDPVSGSVIALTKEGHDLRLGIPARTVDITSQMAVDAAVAELRPSAIIHLAAIAEPAIAEKDPELAYAVNVLGTEHLAKSVLSHVPDARFVFSGSSEVYGRSFNQIDGPLKEDAPILPNTVYGQTKARAEDCLIEQADRGLDVMCFRSFNHTGPGQTDRYVVPAFARQIAEIEFGIRNIVRVGNLTAARDFLDVNDVVSAYRSALETDAQGAQVMNLCSGQARQIRSILVSLIGLSRCDIHYEIDIDRHRPSEVAVAVGDNDRIRTILGWSPATDFNRTLGDILDYWRATISTSNAPA